MSAGNPAAKRQLPFGLPIHELGRPACVTDWAFSRTVASDNRWQRNSALRRSPLIDVVKRPNLEMKAFVSHPNTPEDSMAIA